MTTSASLDSSSVRLDPGGEAVIPLQIRNDGELVEGYRIEVVGPATSWAVVEPAEVSLYPGTSTTATISFRPPAGAAVPAGEHSFGVVVTPTQHPDEAVVPEGVVEVLPYLDTLAEMTPHTSQGSRKGRHRIAVDNRGNTGVNALLAGADDTGLLRFRVDPPGISVPAGEARFAEVRVLPDKRIWRGDPITHPFTINVTPEDSPAVSLDGTYLQQPVLPKWFFKALLAALALLLLLAALWFLLLKPTISSAAQEAVDDQVKEAEQQAAQAEEAAQAAQEAAGASQESAGEAEQQVTKVTGVEPTITAPFGQRLTVETATEAVDFVTVPDGQTLKLTDLVLSNPQGDFGRLFLLVDDEVVIDTALENFRDLDYHFVSPINAAAGQEISLQVQCRQPGEPPGAATPPDTCSESVYLGGETIRKRQ